MQITVDTKGPSFSKIANDMARDVQSATRKVGRQIADVGSRAIESNAPTWNGRRLGVRTKIHGGSNAADVEFRGTPAGPWSILESGARPHLERAHRRTMRFEGRYATVVHHPGQRGQQRWTKATNHLAQVVTPVVERTYVQALD